MAPLALGAVSSASFFSPPPRGPGDRQNDRQRDSPGDSQGSRTPSEARGGLRGGPHSAPPSAGGASVSASVGGAIGAFATAERARASLEGRPLPKIGQAAMLAASHANIGQAAMRLHALDLHSVGERNAARRQLQWRQQAAADAQAAAEAHASLDASARHLQSVLRGRIARRSYKEKQLAVTRIRLNRVARVIQTGWRQYMSRRFGPSFAQIVITRFRERRRVEAIMTELIDQMIVVTVKRAREPGSRRRRRPTCETSPAALRPPGSDGHDSAQSPQTSLDVPGGAAATAAVASGAMIVRSQEGQAPRDMPRSKGHSPRASTATPTRSSQPAASRIERAASAKAMLATATMLADAVDRRERNEASTSRTRTPAGPATETQAASKIRGAAGPGGAHLSTKSKGGSRGSATARGRMASSAVTAAYALESASSPRGPAKLKKGSSKKAVG